MSREEKSRKIRTQLTRMANKKDSWTQDLKKKKSTLIVCYGRRRIGKSFLLQKHIQNRRSFQFEGVEGQSSSFQIQFFVNAVMSRFDLRPNEVRASSIRNWDAALQLLSLQIPNDGQHKFIIFFDEFQWKAAGRSLLPAIIKRIWDNQWLNKNIQLILCGSVSSYMVGKVIKSKALYGRINIEVKIGFLPTSEAVQFFSKKKSLSEIMRYLVVLGGTPKYLSDLNQSHTFDENIAEMFFEVHSGYVNEFEKIFYSQFKEHKIYEKIVEYISTGPKKLEDVAKAVKMKSGGGLKSYLSNLEKAQFLRSCPSNPNNSNSKIILYRLTDPFLRFYFAFIKPNQQIILAAKNPAQVMATIVNKRMDIFLGYAFENYCFINAFEIAEKLGISDSITSFGPLYFKDRAQIDLVYFRKEETINLVEIKFQNREIEPSVIVEVEKKWQPFGHSIQILLCNAPSSVSVSHLKNYCFQNILIRP